MQRIVTLEKNQLMPKIIQKIEVMQNFQEIGRKLINSTKTSHKKIKLVEHTWYVSINIHNTQFRKKANYLKSSM